MRDSISLEQPLTADNGSHRELAPLAMQLVVRASMLTLGDIPATHCRDVKTDVSFDVMTFDFSNVGVFLF